MKGGFEHFCHATIELGEIRGKFHDPSPLIREIASCGVAC
jgi:hypothetical protein